MAAPIAVSPSRAHAHSSIQCASAALLGHFCGGGKKGLVNLFAHARDSLGYAWIFSVYLLVVFRYIPAYVQRMMAESDAAAYSL